MTGEWIRFLIGAVLLCGGLLVEILAIISVFRFNYVLNRMQISAVADTMGLMLILAGLMVFSGRTILTVKLLLIILFYWLAGPVSSHLMARLERLTNEKSGEEYDVITIEKAKSGDEPREGQPR